MHAHSLSEPPPDAVADNRIADLLGDGVADTRRSAVAAVENFDQKKPPAALFTTADGQESARLRSRLGFGRQRLAGCGQRSRLPFRR